MANNQYVNKVIYNGEVKIDLTGVTVTAGDVAQGYTTHNGAGQQITGTALNAQCVVVVNNLRAILIIPTGLGRVEGTKLILTERS